MVLSVCLMVMVVMPTSDVSGWGKKYIKFTEFIPTERQQEVILGIINDFQETANKGDKNAHFDLFVDDSIIIVDVSGGRYHKEMDGKQEIINKTPWTGTTIEFTKIWFGKIENGKAIVNTKTVLRGGDRGTRYATYEWVLTQVQDSKDSWKIQKLTMNIDV